MKKFFLLFFAIIFLLVFFNLNKARKNDFYRVEKLLKVNIPKDSTILKSSDTHGGPHGDGKTNILIQLTDEGMQNLVDNIEEKDNWSHLPLSEDINKIFYLNSMNGLYFVKDRFAESYPNYKHKNINSRPSYNITIAMIDFDTNRLYFYELDT